LRRLLLATAAVTVAALLVAPVASAVDPVNTSRLRAGVTLDGMLQHERAFQDIALANNDTRAAGTAGYDGSVQYVMGRLEAAGYDVSLDEFDFARWEQTGPSVLQFGATTYQEGTDYLTPTLSGGGDVTATIVPTNDIVLPPGAAPNTSNSGCEAADFPANTAGNVALIQRGTCSFVAKINNAKAAGAAAVLIFNEGQTDPPRSDAVAFNAPPFIGIPVLSTSFAVGETLYNAPDDAQVRVAVNATTTPITQANVIADSPRGDADRTIVVGAHLDSVQAGPGINDNGSGSSMILEIAEEVAELPANPRNRLRFAFWGAEEAGLIGSTEYVAGLSPAGLRDIAMNLNFDMVGSPNFVRFVYDGDTSDTPPPAGGAPTGSGTIEQVFLGHFRSQGLAAAPTAFDGRSDYGPFIAQGIPAGGLFTGAEGIKTPAQEEVYGGVAGLAYDPCYHQACDTFFNLNYTALDQMSDAAAHTAWTFARQRGPIPGATAATAKGTSKSRTRRLAFKGHLRVR
jgi:Zn-dependent M28 family amino/carboxypeptidase